jgi:hypothetical protein
LAIILTKVEEPNLFPGNPVACMIPERRLECKGRDPAVVTNLLRPKFEGFVEKQKEQSLIEGFGTS